MKLSKKEKQAIFWALLDKYPEHERGRQQANMFFGNDPVKLKWALNSINKSEEDSYELIKRFSYDVGVKLPERVVKL